MAKVADFSSGPTLLTSDLNVNGDPYDPAARFVDLRGLTSEWCTAACRTTAFPSSGLCAGVLLTHLPTVCVVAACLLPRRHRPACLPACSRCRDHRLCRFGLPAPLPCLLACLQVP